MPRGGDGAAGLEDERAALDGTKGATAGKGGMFDGSRLTRSHPWKRDGSQRTEILAGQVDSSGKFRGIAIQDVSMQALSRYFSLASTCVPASMPPSVAEISTILEEGFPLIVLTRGLWGRELDNGVGPTSNMNQDSVWQRVRTARAENPRLLVTCVDVPHDLDGDDLEAVLRPPLNEFRELMFQDGKWYTPKVESAAAVAKQLKDMAASTKSVGKPRNSVSFNRKKFEWRADDSVNSMFTIIWQEVLEVRPALGDQPRTDLDFTDAKPVVASREMPSYAAIRLKQSLAKADDAAAKLAAVDEFLSAGAKFSGDEKALKDALAASKDAADSLGKEDAAKATKNSVAIAMLQRDYDAAVSLAADLQKAYKNLKDGKGQVGAVGLAVKAHLAMRKVGDAVKAATTAQQDLDKSGDKDEASSCLDLAITTQMDQGDYEGALKTATAAKDAYKKAKSPQQEGAAWLSIGGVHIAKEEYDDALKAQTEARSVYKGAKDAKGELNALEAMYHSQEAKGNADDAHSTAKDMVSLAKEKASQALAKYLLASSHLLKSMIGDEKEMLDAAKEAVEKYESLDDKKGLANAQQCYASALLASKDGQESVDLALSTAQAAVATHKAAGGGKAMSQALVACARANLMKGNAYSAMWDAKQVVTNAQEHGDQNMVSLGMDLMSEASSGLSKPTQVGPFVPVNQDGYVSYV